jgi:Kef-type K+ transport system membrane component KefB
MSFATLALISAVALLGPLLATPVRWHVPVVIGELAAGIALGRTGTGTLHPDDHTFTLLADVGFALVMFVAGSHVPVRDARLRPALSAGLLRALTVAALAVPVGLLIAHWFGTGHTALYAVLIASSSAALVLPIIDADRLSGPTVLPTIAQVAIADTACIIALPLVIDPGRAGKTALGVLAVIGCSLVLYALLQVAERSGRRKQLHRLSERRAFALELRISLLILFALAALATRTNVSILLAGFTFGMAVSGMGEPRRLARQLFALTEGFLGPLFFVWLGASLDIRELGQHPAMIGLGVVLGLAGVAVHIVTKLLGAPLPLAVLSAAQLGVPVAAATLGTQQHLLTSAEAAALVLGALVTITAASVAATQLGRSAHRPKDVATSAG